MIAFGWFGSDRIYDYLLDVVFRRHHRQTRPAGLCIAKVRLHEGIRTGCVSDPKLARLVATSTPEFSTIDNGQAVVASCGDRTRRRSYV